MKKLLCLVLLLKTSASIAQNLVANPSFEAYINCPGDMGQIQFPSGGESTVRNWFKPTVGSSDYFNACYGTEIIYGLSVPENSIGIQEAHYGQAYTGAICYSEAMTYPDYREYVESELLSPMIAGHLYFASFYTSLAERRGEGAPIVAIDQMGIYFCSDSLEITGFGSVLSDFTPQVVSPYGMMLADTLEWMNISGSFVASGDEQWIIGGNFTPVDNLTIEVIAPGTMGLSSYYYFDDFCVLDINTISENTTIDTVICPGLTLQSNGREGYTHYIWDDGSTMKERSLNSPGTYWVASIDANTCIGHVDSIKISHEVMPEFHLGNDTVICNGDQILLEVDNPVLHSFLWSTGATTRSLMASYPGTYTVAASSECYTIRDTIVLYTIPEPSIELGPDIELCDGEQVVLGTDEPDFHYQWNTGEQTCCINVITDGTYMVTAANACGETATDEVGVSFSNCEHCILIPNAFSPNGDGLNDELEVYIGCPVKDYEINIFNRWGQLVFSSVAPGDNWDGYLNGQPADIGVYFYIIEATPVISSIGKIKTKGDVTLIR